MTLTNYAVLLGTAALSIAAAQASGVAHRATAHPPKGNPSLTVLYDQTANNSFTGTPSQDLGDAGSAAAADDFTVPEGQSWTVNEVDITGIYFNGYGPASSETVTFYSGSKKPGKAIAEFDSIKGADNGGSFAIALPGKGVKLKGGTRYWVSVVINGKLQDGSQWVWSNQTTQEGRPAMWQSPGTACGTWKPEKKCLGAPGDQMFALRGTAS